MQSTEVEKLMRDLCGCDVAMEVYAPPRLHMEPLRFVWRFRLGDRAIDVPADSDSVALRAAAKALTE